ncbi:multinuclear nonheme iron-dependent oxidase [Archangium lansingense]|uniref:DUF692 family protein n=1 Tax=Archangium lansingense TaxID=2995310 RepID=A0ABT4ACE0_9BACT|nr:DUF692 family multinuclear iron-containing protein [Archangium lansinium]MCY1078889.1 DUF692 family protein [Archangium lansinium]
MNWTRASRLPLIQQLLRTGHADFCEILIDNFFLVPPVEVRRALGDVPVAFHIMHSRFLERDDTTLAAMASRLRLLARELKPLYISDHLLRFTVEGREVPLLPELEYGHVYEHARQRVGLWQEMLGTQVYFENYPSLLEIGRDQPAFFEALVADTGMGVLFDLSNAICAWRNCGVKPDAWARLLPGVKHFHAGGYDVLPEPSTAFDTHGGELAGDTLQLMQETLAQARQATTLCIERDRDVGFEAWSRDLVAAREWGGRHAH